MSEHEKTAAGGQVQDVVMPPAEGEILFEYKGDVYFRPIGRGICFVEPFIWRGEQMPADQLQLEEMFDGDYTMEVVIRRRK
jgi:hypothetical protein